MQADAIFAVGFSLMIAVGCVVFVVGAVAAIRGDNPFRIPDRGIPSVLVQHHEVRQGGQPEAKPR